MATKLIWPKRAKRETHAILGLREKWQAKCKCYKVERFPENHVTLPWIACHALPGAPFAVLSRHNTRPAAMRACETHARRHAPPPAKVSTKRTRKSAQ